MSNNSPQDEKVKQKSDKMTKKTIEYCKLFNLSPSSEKVIQDYSCSERGSLTGGNLHISQNYVCFHSKLPHKLEKIPFKRITDVKEEKHILRTYICIETETKTSYYFGSFWSSQAYSEALALIRYLWQNPPSYVSVSAMIEDEEKKKLAAKEEEKKREIEKQQQLQQPGLVEDTNPFGGKIIGTSSWDVDDSWSQNNRSSYSTSTSVSSPSSGTQATATVEVDTSAAKRALAIAREAQQLGTDTLKTLAEQAEQIDRIEQNVENIHDNLDKGERLIRGMESLPAYIGNALSKKRKQRVIQAAKDRSIAIKKGKAPTMDVEILCKLPDDSLVEAVLCLGESGFTCVDPNTEELIRPFHTYSYDDIEKIVMRARAEHCDVRFKQSSGKDRFRMMSSYIQIITNEILLRTKEGQVQVQFEPGSTVFEYDHPRISVQPTTTRKTAGGGFVRKEAQIKTSSLLTENASQETRDALDEVDKDLDDIADVLGNLGNIATTMGGEIDRQNEQLNRINNRVDQANDRIQGDNKRLNNLLKS
eukprot:TRINITY_DN3057_c0_g1_i1.p1 TRINITY_DN3057_c0_g1~~TRINITY_DN3057_c0_g1_i1.p1  ORF type:complete len:532 (+),score=145.78 TRINITY_DN3057_c0_g1_i1:41-1636(+)